MKKFFSFLFSMYFSVLLLILFAVSIAYATFLENDYGTDTAQLLIYKSWWFELILAVGIVNLSGSVFRYKLVNRKKWAILLFHLAFIVILIGAGVTRYWGFEGNMHIREGEATNVVVSDETYITARAEAGSQTDSLVTRAKFTPNTYNRYRKSLVVAGKKVTIENEVFVPNASETVVPDASGMPVISLLYSDPEQPGIAFVLCQNEERNMGQATFGFETGSGSADVVFSRYGNLLMVTGSDTLVVSVMMGQSTEKLAPNVAHPIVPTSFYTIGHAGFVIQKYFPAGSPSLVQLPAKAGAPGMDAFTAKITSGNEVRRLNVFTSSATILPSVSCTVNGVKVSLRYGPIEYRLPFSIYLRDFQIDRYPGSRSPSSYASEITLKDPSASVTLPFRIFMNNILKYKGYRFFQSSFDQDEKGTVLSVNHDYWGTFISYLGYFLMTLGMIFTVFSRQSRFRTLVRLSSKLQARRQSMKMLIFGIVVSGWSLHPISTFAANEKASQAKVIDAFSEILVQDNQGRVEPVNTLASDLLRKISRKSKWNGMTASEVFLDMNANPAKWKNIPMIKVANNELMKMLGYSGGFVTFAQMFDGAGNYRLNSLVEEAYNKRQTSRNKLDKEMINVDERVNICYEIFNGDFLKIFPIPGDPDKTWTTSSKLPAGLDKKEADFAGNILNLLYTEYNQSANSGNWSKPLEYIGYIRKYQDTYGSAVIPTESRIRMEILYNNWDIFGKMAKIYAALGFMLLIFHFVLIFKPSAGISKLVFVGSVLIFIAFLFYSGGLAIRWYISGHAPWSNGYETMIYVGWATSLAGLVFVRRSPITLAVTTILSSIILFVAGMSWMNPEITNLVPVLKSYWLVIHVAVITASYGFLAMGALLGMLNLVLMMVRNKKNNQSISFTIIEIAYIIEMALIIGLLMLTVGAFIGGVWANESWGRYWGWDPKETWALVSILVYSIILHLKKVPGLKSIFLLSSLALLGISSVLMTFFGVNYYLSGMHSYGQGDPPPIPNGAYVAIVVVVLLIWGARRAEKRMGKISDPSDLPED
jgi:cytochrome c-type biogenesis protein CcsB